jgi:hypothetical protein
MDKVNAGGKNNNKPIYRTGRARPRPMFDALIHKRQFSKISVSFAV